MQRVFISAACLLLSCSLAYALLKGHPWQWSASYTAGGTCNVASGGTAFCGGTEVRQFAVINQGTRTATLFSINGYAADTPGVEGVQNAEVLELDCPQPAYIEGGGCSWQISTNLGGASTGGLYGGAFCPADNTTCALAGSALATLNFVYDSGNNPVSVSVVEAATWYRGSSATACPGQTPIYTFSRNNTDHVWYQDLILCDTGAPGDGLPQIRSYGTHVDQVLGTGCDTLSGTGCVNLAFLGEGPSGIWTGTLSTTRGAGHDPIIWSSGLANREWNTANYSGPPCTRQTRPLSFAEQTGPDGVLREYMSACFSIYVRIDGPQNQVSPPVTCNPDQVVVSNACQQRWQLYWSNPTPGASSQSGNRGMTAITNAGDGVLLVGTEGGLVSQYRVPAYNSAGGDCRTNPSCATREYNNVTEFQSNISGIDVGNLISPYNQWSLWYDNGGTGRRIAGQNTHVAAAQSTTMPFGYTYEYVAPNNLRLIASAFWLFRTNAGNYNLMRIPDNLFTTPLVATRDAIMSPWPAECNNGSNNGCAIYFAGYDYENGSSYYWCKTNPCPTSPPYVPMHNTGWIARYGP